MTKVIFTDIDNVINWTSRVGREIFSGERQNEGRITLDNVSVGLLNELCRQTGAVLVLISSMRGGADIIEKLIDKGVVNQFHEVPITPPL